MKRAKLKLHQLPTQPQNPHQQQIGQMSPWSKDHHISKINQCNQIQRIPTQRLEIVQKFFSNLQTKSKKISNTLKNSQRRKNKSKTIKSSSNNSSISNNHKSNNSLEHNKSISKNYSTLNNTLNLNDDDQQLQIVKMFKKHRQQSNKSRVKTTVINLDTEFQNQTKRSKSKMYGQNRRSVTLGHEDNKKTFARKLRLKQQLANKKNIQRVYSKNKPKQPRSYSCMSKNSFYLFQLGNIGAVKTGNYQSMYPAAHRRKVLQLKNQRPASQVVLRPKSSAAQLI